MQGLPNTFTSPDEGASKPAPTFSSVDLPQPVGPTTETNSPGAMEIEASLTAVYPPLPPSCAAKVQVMLSSNSAASGIRILFIGFGHEIVGPDF